MLETLSEPDQLKSCNAKFLRGMFEVPECDVFLCTGSSGDRMNAKFDQFGQERRNFGVLGLVTRVMQVYPGATKTQCFSNHRGANIQRDLEFETDNNKFLENWLT